MSTPFVLICPAPAPPAKLTSASSGRLRALHGFAVHMLAPVHTFKCLAHLCASGNTRVSVCFAWTGIHIFTCHGLFLCFPGGIVQCVKSCSLIYQLLPSRECCHDRFLLSHAASNDAVMAYIWVLS
jgi:hypothetical protein